MDDDPALLAELAELILLWGHEAISFSEPVAALSYVRDGGADVLISDLEMRAMSGEELLRQIASSHPGLKIGLMSGGAFPNELRGRGWPLFGKPVSPDALKRFIET